MQRFGLPASFQPSPQDSKSCLQCMTPCDCSISRRAMSPVLFTKDQALLPLMVGDHIARACPHSLRKRVPPSVTEADAK